MEFFILAIVDRARLTTMYSLRQEAGLESGSIRPALNNLEREGLLSRAESGPRHRREFDLSESGAKLLSEHWQECLRGRDDIDVILRSACVAELMGDMQTSSQYLTKMTFKRSEQARNLQVPLPPHRSDIDPLSQYMWRRVVCESRRLAGEASALTVICEPGPLH